MTKKAEVAIKMKWKNKQNMMKKKFEAKKTALQRSLYIQTHTYK